MWIAKPVSLLVPSERKAWIATQDSLRARGRDFPLSQTLVWAEATESAGGRSYLVHCPEESVGGIVHGFPSADAPSSKISRFECTNGPLLDWDDSTRATRQLATFAMAVSRLSPRFESMALRPRFPSERMDEYTRHLPVRPSVNHQAATLQVPVLGEPARQREQARPRLRRTLAHTERAGVRTSWEPATPQRIGLFAARMREFGLARDFYVPDPSWFEALVRDAPGREPVSFHLARAELDSACVSEILVCVSRQTAHYLFGREERAHRVPAAISTAAAAHFRALAECASLGATLYDMNGFTDPGDLMHPYAGVAGFKSQFGGRVIRYSSPELRIS